jgi:ribosomal protein S14
MKKLLSKDKNFRLILKIINIKYFVLKSITKNKQFLIFTRYKAYLKLKKLVKLYSIISIVNRCIQSINKKSFNKFSLFSRFIYLKLIRHGNISGFQKSSW